MINNRVRAATAGRPDPERPAPRGHPARLLEYVGVIALAIALVIGIAVVGWGDQLRPITTQVACAVTPRPDCPAQPSVAR